MEQETPSSTLGFLQTHTIGSPSPCKRHLHFRMREIRQNRKKQGRKEEGEERVKRGGQEGRKQLKKERMKRKQEGRGKPDFPHSQHPAMYKARKNWTLREGCRGAAVQWGGGAAKQQPHIGHG